VTTTSPVHAASERACEPLLGSNSKMDFRKYIRRAEKQNSHASGVSHKKERVFY